MAFGGKPTLHTAAHEAAHVVQQRGGVQLAGGVGQEGDPHERHADAVADRVVAGRSAEDLLDGLIGSGDVRRGDPSPPAFAARSVQRTSAGGVSVSNMRFAPREIKDDGATTTNATVAYSARMGGPAALNWTIEGAAFGATVDATGKVTPGTDTVPNDKQKVSITVKAVDSVQAGAHTTGRVTMWSRRFLQAKADLATFRGATYTKANFTSGLNGKYDAIYDPRRRRFTAEVRLNYVFLDDQPGAAKWNARSKAQFMRRFHAQVASVWSEQWRFENVREPKIAWKALNPIRVTARVKRDAAAPHFTAQIHKAAPGSAVNAGVANLDNPSLAPLRGGFSPAAPNADLATLQGKTPTPIQFAAGDATIPAATQPQLDFMATMLQSMRQPPFDVTITGHTATGGAAGAARRLAGRRAAAVRDVLRARAAGVHRLSVVNKAQTAGVAAPGGDKVEIASAVRAGHQDTFMALSHEFGHMIGLGDQYPTGNGGLGAAASHNAATQTAFGGQLGTDMASTFAKVVTNTEGIMGAGGSDVRPVHYVTLWQGLVAAAATAAVPAPLFGQADWKFVGF